MFSKKMNDFKNALLPLHFVSHNQCGKPIQHVISFWLRGKAVWTVFKLNKRKAVRDAKSNIFAEILLLKKKVFVTLLCHVVLRSL